MSTLGSGLSGPRQRALEDIAEKEIFYVKPVLWTVFGERSKKQKAERRKSAWWAILLGGQCQGIV